MKYLKSIGYEMPKIKLDVDETKGKPKNNKKNITK